MAKNRSDSSKWESSYAPPGTIIYVSASQLLAERMCARQAKKAKQYLPPKFWNDTTWKKPFLLQLKHANDLLKLYPIGVILEAFKDYRLNKVFSLGLKSVIAPVCDEIQKKLALQPESSSAIVATDTNQKPRPQIGQKNLISKLKDLD